MHTTPYLDFHLNYFLAQWVSYPPHITLPPLWWEHLLLHTIHVKSTKPFPSGIQINLEGHISDFLNDYVMSLPRIVKVGRIMGRNINMKSPTTNSHHQLPTMVNLLAFLFFCLSFKCPFKMSCNWQLWAIR